MRLAVLALAQPWLVKTLIDEACWHAITTLWHMAAVMILAGVFGTLLAGINATRACRGASCLPCAMTSIGICSSSPMFYGRRRTGDTARRRCRRDPALCRGLAVLGGVQRDRLARRVGTDADALLAIVAVAGAVDSHRSAVAALDAACVERRCAACASVRRMCRRFWSKPCRP